MNAIALLKFKYKDSNGNEVEVLVGDMAADVDSSGYTETEVSTYPPPLKVEKVGYCTANVGGGNFPIVFLAICLEQDNTPKIIGDPSKTNCKNSIPTSCSAMTNTFSVTGDIIGGRVSQKQESNPAQNVFYSLEFIQYNSQSITCQGTNFSINSAIASQTLPVKSLDPMVSLPINAQSSVTPCGTFVYELSPNTSPVVQIVNGEIQLYSSSYTDRVSPFDVNPRSFSLTVSLQEDSNISAVFTFTVDLNTCPTTFFTAYTVDTDQNLLNVPTDGAQRVGLISFTDKVANEIEYIPGYCGGYSYSYAKKNSGDTFNFSNPQFQIVGNEIQFSSTSALDLTLINPNPITLVLTATMNDYPDITQSVDFQVGLFDPCPLVTFTNTPAINPLNAYRMSPSSTRSETISYSTSFTWDVVTGCNPMQFELECFSTCSTGGQALIDSVNAGTGITASFIALDLDTAVHGHFTDQFVITAFDPSYPSQVTAQTDAFSITVFDYICTNVTPVVPASGIYEYTVGAQTNINSIVFRVESNPQFPTAQYGQLANTVTVDQFPPLLPYTVTSSGNVSEDVQFDLNSVTQGDIGLYSFLIDLQLEPPYDSEETAFCYFDLEIKELPPPVCVGTDFSIDAAIASQTLPVISLDSMVSLPINAYSSVTPCGTFVYELSPDYSPVVQIVNGEIQLISTNFTDRLSPFVANPQTFTLKVSLQEDSTIFEEFNFSVTLNTCPTTFFSTFIVDTAQQLLNVPTDGSQRVGQISLTNKVANEIEMNPSYCGGWTYTYALKNSWETFQASNLQFLIVGNEIQFSSTTISDLTYINPNPITLVLTATMNEYPDITQSVDFQVGLFDPCPLVTFTNTPVIDPVFAYRMSPSSTRSETISYSPSFTWTVVTGCNPMQFKLECVSTCSTGGQALIDSVNAGTGITASFIALDLDTEVHGHFTDQFVIRAFDPSYPSQVTAQTNAFSITVFDYICSNITPVVPASGYYEYTVGAQTNINSIVFRVESNPQFPTQYGVLANTVTVNVSKDSGASLPISSYPFMLHQVLSLGNVIKDVQVDLISVTLGDIGLYDFSITLQLASPYDFETPAECAFQLEIKDPCSHVSFTSIPVINPLNAYRMVPSSTRSEIISYSPSFTWDVVTGCNQIMQFKLECVSTCSAGGQALIDSVNAGTGITASEFALDLDTAVHGHFTDQFVITAFDPSYPNDVTASTDAFSITVFDYICSNITPDASGIYEYIVGASTNINSIVVRVESNPQFPTAQFGQLVNTVTVNVSKDSGASLPISSYSFMSESVTSSGNVIVDVQVDLNSVTLGDIGLYDFSIALQHESPYNLETPAECAFQLEIKELPPQEVIATQTNTLLPNYQIMSPTEMPPYYEIAKGDTLSFDFELGDLNAIEIQESGGQVAGPYELILDPSYASYGSNLISFSATNPSDSSAESGQLTIVFQGSASDDLSGFQGLDGIAGNPENFTAQAPYIFDADRLQCYLPIEVKIRVIAEDGKKFDFPVSFRIYSQEMTFLGDVPNEELTTDENILIDSEGPINNSSSSSSESTRQQTIIQNSNEEIKKFFSGYSPQQVQKLISVAEAKPILMYFDQITAAGEIILKFEPKFVLVPNDWQKFWSKNGPNLPTLKHDKEIFIKKLNDLLSCQFIKNSFEKDQSQFNFTISDFNTERIAIQLNFSDPLLISQGQIEDNVSIRLNKEYFTKPDYRMYLPFMSEGRLLQASYQVNAEYKDMADLEYRRQEIMRNAKVLQVTDDGKYLEITLELPKQVGSLEELQTLQTAATSVSNYLQSQLTVSFFLNFFLSGLLTQLWNIFNTLQIIIALNYLMVQFPANIESLTKEISGVANFQVIEKNVLYQMIFGGSEGIQQNDITEDEDDDDQSMEKQKIKKLNATANIGSNLIENILIALLALVSLLVLIIIFFLCKRIIFPRCCNCFKQFAWLIEKKLMFNSVLRVMQETYLNLAIAALYQTTLLKFETTQNQINSFFAIFLVIYLIGFPVLQCLMLQVKFEKLSEPTFKQRYGSLYQNVYEFNRKTILFTLFFLLRRLAVAGIIIYAKIAVSVQIGLMNLSSLIVLTYYIQVKPMSDGIQNFIQLFNEVMLLVIYHNLFFFTDFVTDPEQRYNFGYLTLAFVSLDIGVNVVILFITLIRQGIAYCKRRTALKKQKQQVEEQRAEQIKLQFAIAQQNLVAKKRRENMQALGICQEENDEDSNQSIGNCKGQKSHSSQSSPSGSESSGSSRSDCSQSNQDSSSSQSVSDSQNSQSDSSQSNQSASNSGLNRKRTKQNSRKRKGKSSKASSELSKSESSQQSNSSVSESSQSYSESQNSSSVSQSSLSNLKKSKKSKASQQSRNSQKSKSSSGSSYCDSDCSCESCQKSASSSSSQSQSSNSVQSQDKSRKSQQESSSNSENSQSESSQTPSDLSSSDPFASQNAKSQEVEESESSSDSENSSSSSDYDSEGSSSSYESSSSNSKESRPKSKEAVSKSKKTSSKREEQNNSEFPDRLSDYFMDDKCFNQNPLTSQDLKLKEQQAVLVNQKHKINKNAGLAQMKINLDKSTKLVSAESLVEAALDFYDHGMEFDTPSPYNKVIDKGEVFESRNSSRKKAAGLFQTQRKKLGTQINGLVNKDVQPGLAASSSDAQQESHK